jgi:glycosyltransferase involved in cell wall biosynthesis
MGISAVICTRNRHETIGRAVQSVLNNDYPDFDLTVVDQSDTDLTWAALKEVAGQDGRLHYIHTSRAGLSAAYNLGIANSQHELLAFTDDDCVAPPHWLQNIEQAFERAQNCDLLYGQVLAPAELDGAAGVLPTLAISRRAIIDRRSHFRVFGMGANFAARRELFRAVGPFDEVLGGGGALRSSQDFDLAFRVYRAGRSILLEPDVTVDHYGLRSDVDWPKTMTAYGIGDGGFYMKHVRCGDLLAARLLTACLIGQTVRSVVKPLIGRPHATEYLRGVLRGMADSFGFGLDRGRRLYLAR